MLRVVFLGMDLRILDGLRRCPVHLIGAHLPPAPYQFLHKFPALSKFLAKYLLRKPFKTASVYLPLADFLSLHNIPALRGVDVNTIGFRQMLAGLAPDLGVVANFGQILGADLISIPKQGLINFHPSLLPHYRGPTPLGHILLNQEKFSGATWHRVTTSVDSGDILAQAQFAISDQDTVKDLDQKSIAVAIDMLCPLIERIAQDKTHPLPQDEAKAFYCAKLTHQEKIELAAMGKLN